MHKGSGQAGAARAHTRGPRAEAVPLWWKRRLSFPFSRVVAYYRARRYVHFSLKPDTKSKKKLAATPEPSRRPNPLKYVEEQSILPKERDRVTRREYCGEGINVAFSRFPPSALCPVAGTRHSGQMEGRDSGESLPEKFPELRSKNTTV